MAASFSAAAQARLRELKEEALLSLESLPLARRAGAEPQTRVLLNACNILKFKYRESMHEGEWLNAYFYGVRFVTVAVAALKEQATAVTLRETFRVLQLDVSDVATALQTRVRAHLLAQIEAGEHAARPAAAAAASGGAGSQAARSAALSAGRTSASASSYSDFSAPATRSAPTPAPAPAPAQVPAPAPLPAPAPARHNFAASSFSSSSSSSSYGSAPGPAAAAYVRSGDALAGAHAQQRPGGHGALPPSSPIAAPELSYPSLGGRGGTLAPPAAAPPYYAPQAPYATAPYATAPPAPAPTPPPLALAAGSAGSHAHAHAHAPVPPPAVCAPQLMAPHARPPYETQLRQLLLPEQLIATFLQLAHSNTVTGERGLETCAVLGGTLVPGRGGGGGGGGGRSGYMPRALAVTHLIVPKQRGLPDSTEMLAEDELIEAYTTNDVIQLGWIHTHPSQDAFLSSVDLHTHLGYQQLLPESVAVVVAPRCANAFAVFRLTDGEDCVAGRASASGIDVIAACGERGFHSGHMGVEGAEGVVYERSSHVVLDKSLAVTVVDLR